MIITTLANLAKILLLAASLPLAILAYRGYRGTPWGRVLQPIPVVEVSFILYLVIVILGIDAPAVHGFAVVAWAVGTLAACLSALRLTLLLRGDRV
ncbi:hypothetical protein [Halorussus halobius]|uniref:hypothetical protein n=1 Tax=Halorussus halobius TaxID=1710537 RepID=UPI0010921347|nr:hypothetical protein [Halorussus halobius]